MLCAFAAGFLGDATLLPQPAQYSMMGVYTAYPYSRGSIHITSATDPLNGYVFDTGFLNHPSDIKKQLWAYKMSREIARRLPFYNGEVELAHPKFAAGSPAANRDSGFKDGEEVSDILYTQEDDAVIEDWIRGNLNTTWHSLGTCPMKPREKGGVVDGSLNVYGTQGLKVADLSIPPENVGANTNNTALVIGEKAAVIIGRELGIKV